MELIRTGCPPSPAYPDGSDIKIIANGTLPLLPF